LRNGHEATDSLLELQQPLRMGLSQVPDVGRHAAGYEVLTMDKPRKNRPGYRWERRSGCDCKSCPWKGNCLGERRPHWIEVKEATEDDK